MSVSFPNNITCSTPVLKRPYPNRAVFLGNNQENSEQTTPNYENPVNQTGEYFNALNKSFYKSLGIGSRVFISIYPGNSSDLGTTAIIGGVAAAAAFLYNLPKNLYQANIDYFTKRKQMDVFVRENSIEKDTYDKMNEKIKKGDKNQIDNYQKIRLARSDAPEELTKKSNGNEFLNGFLLLS